MLTKQKAETAPPKDKEYSLFDSDGLYLRVLPSGRKTWYIRLYGIGGKITQKSLGQYSEIDITGARKKRDRLKAELNPDPEKLTLRQLGERWIKEYSEVSAKGMVYNHKLYLSYLDPILSKRAAALTRKDLVDMLRIIQEDHSYETARRVGVALGQMYQHAVNSGLLSFSPAVRLSSALIRPEEAREDKHYAAILDEEGIGRLLRSLDSIKSDVIRRALWFITYTFPRSGELCKAQWEEIDTDQARWTIPAGHTKRRKQHIIPLSRQALDILKEQGIKTTGYVFPSDRTGKNLEGSTLIAALHSLRRLPDDERPEEMTVHGFRATASTLLNASGLWRPDAIERQLSHAPEDKIREAYNRGDYMEERVRMMQWYADKIDDLYANDMI